MKSPGLLLALCSALALGAEPAPTAAARLAIPYAPPLEPAKPAAAEAPPGVVVLPRFDVNDSRLRFDEHELFTDQGILESAQKQYLSPVYQKVFGPLVQLGAYYMDFLSILGGWHPNEVEALDIYWAHERLRRISKFDEVIDLTRIMDPKEARELEDMRTQTFRFDLDRPRMLYAPRRHK